MAQKPVKLLNCHLLIHPELIDQLPRIHTLIGDRPAILGMLADRLFLYDRVVIPTADFSIAPVLVGWLGDGLLTELLDSGALSFLRYRERLGYGSDGIGLATYRIEPPDRHPRNTRQDTPIADSDVATDVWLAEALPDLKGQNRARLVSAVVEHTDELAEIPDFDKNVAHETYMDALNSPLLRRLFGMRSTHLTRLQGIGPNQMRAFAPQANYGKRTDEIDTLLGMAAANFELYLAHLSGADDVALDPSIQKFLTGKAERALKSLDLARGFVEILDLNDLPDLATAVASRRLSPAEVWRIRNSENGIQFRRWFHEHVRDEPERAVKEYVAALGTQSWMDSIPAKVLRFVLTNSASLVPAAGVIASAIDSFLLDRIAKGYSPKYVIDDLRQALPSPTGAADPVRGTEASPRSPRSRPLL